MLVAVVQASRRDLRDGARLQPRFSVCPLLHRDGRGVNRDNEVKARRGVGLTNIRSRLEQLYGTGHRFKLENQATGAVLVQITLPFRRTEKDAATAERPAP